jgi:hypothetical protein
LCGASVHGTLRRDSFGRASSITISGMQSFGSLWFTQRHHQAGRYGTENDEQRGFLI